MMQIGIISALKNGEKIKKSIEDSQDLANCLVFETLEEFVYQTKMRNLEIDRVIITENAVKNELDDSYFAEFTNYLMTYYPATAVITISKSETQSKYFANSIGVQKEAHLCNPRVKIQFLVDVAILPVEEIHKKYPELIYQRESESYSEVLDAEEIDTSLFNKKNISTYVDGAKTRKFEGPIAPSKGDDALDSAYKPNFNFDEEQEVETEVEVDPSNYQTASDEETSQGNTELERPTGLSDDQSQEVDPSVETVENVGTEEIDYNEFDNVGEGIDFGEELKPDLDALERQQELQREEQRQQELERERQREEAKRQLEAERQEQERNRSDIEARESEARQDGRIYIDTKKAQDYIGIDLDDSIFDIQEKEQEPKVVTKVVEKIVRIPAENQAIYESTRNKKGVRSIIITGDRNVGSTRLALNLANHFGNQEPTLVVDLDVERKGFLTYLGVEEYIDEPVHIQDSIVHLRTIRLLEELAHLTDFGFYTLTSMWGTEVEEEQVLRLDEILTEQTMFKTVIIDCPIDILYSLPSLILDSKVFVVTGDDKKGAVNTILSLSSISNEYRAVAPLFANASYIIGGSSNVDTFRFNLDYYSEIFALDESQRNWNLLNIFGVLSDTRGIIERLT